MLSKNNSPESETLAFKKSKKREPINDISVLVMSVIPVLIVVIAGFIIDAIPTSYGYQSNINQTIETCFQENNFTVNEYLSRKSLFLDMLSVS